MFLNQLVQVCCAVTSLALVVLILTHRSPAGGGLSALLGGASAGQGRSSGPTKALVRLTWVGVAAWSVSMVAAMVVGR